MWLKKTFEEMSEGILTAAHKRRGNYWTVRKGYISQSTENLYDPDDTELSALGEMRNTWRWDQIPWLAPADHHPL